MTKFIIRRLFLGAIIVFLGAMVLYAVIRCLPTSYVENIARQRASLPGGKSYTEWLSQLNSVYSLDTDIFTGFFRWAGHAIQGEFGDSWAFNMPVVQKFSNVIWYSVVVNAITLIVEMGACIPLGILAARRQYSAVDYAVTVFALMGLSLPSFFLATLLKYIFSVRLNWLDLYGVVGRFYEQMNGWGKFWDMAAHMILPVATLSMLSIGGLMRYTRTNMLEVLGADYIRTARAKGLSEKAVINKHAFRNTLIPLVTYLSYLLPSMFAGSLITETLFQIPGIGYISFQAIVAGDIPFTMFYLVFTFLLTQVSLIVADIMYAVVDPRVRVN